MTLTFEVGGVNQLKAKLSRFSDYITNWKPLYEELSDDFSDIMREQFASEGAYASGGWTKLSSKYSEWKEKNFPGRSILVLSGNMQSSLTFKNDSNAIREIDETTMRLGSKDIKAYWHHFGKGGNPARPIMKLTSNDKTRWVKLMHEFVVTQTRRAALGTKI